MQKGQSEIKQIRAVMGRYGLEVAELKEQLKILNKRVEELEFNAELRIASEALELMEF
jgi:hypothetical protein